MHRSALSNGWLKNPILWTFWSYCLLKASYTEHKTKVGYQEITLEPGQFIFGRKIAAQETGLSEMQIRTCIKSLKSTNNITVKVTNKYSVVTVLNWGVYQFGDDEVNQQNNHQLNQQVTSNYPASNQQLTTNNKGIKINKGIKEEYINRHPSDQGGLGRNLPVNEPQVNATATKEDSSSKPPKKKKSGWTPHEEAPALVDYFNEICQKKFSHSKASMEQLSARLRAGVKPADIRLVMQWVKHTWPTDDHFHKYIDLVTPFRASNFERYLDKAWTWYRTEYKKKEEQPKPQRVMTFAEQKAGARQ